MSQGKSAATQPRPRAWALAAAAMFACGWGGNQFTPLLLMYRRLGGYSAVTVDAFLAAYVVGLVPGLLICGPLSDRFGRKPLMVAGTAASLAASAVLSAGTLGQAPIYVGRLLTGVAVGIAMAVGTSWVKELSQAPYDPEADRGTAARRASLSLTGGLALGPGVAGVLAQWGPWPMVLPYAVHIAVAAGGLVALVTAPETRTAPAGATSMARKDSAGARTSSVWAGIWADLRTPAAGHRRFLRVVVPMAPWIFGASGIAYAVMPQLVDARLGSWGLAYATLLTVLTLGTGAAVAPVAKRLCARSTARAIVVGMTLMTLGMAICAADATLRSPWIALVGAMTLGSAYGICVVSGLLEIQRIAGPDDLAGLTGVYYALAYVGFLLPPVLAALSVALPYTLMLGVIALLALGSLLTVAASANTPLGAAGPVPGPTGPGPASGPASGVGGRTVAEGGPRAGAERSGGETAAGETAGVRATRNGV